MEIVRLEDADNEIFDQICLWYYHWLGIMNGESFEEIRYTFLHSLNTDRLPQTYVALIQGTPVGMYQLAVSDDLNSRPDLYPWLINLYVDEKFRGQGVGKALLNTVPVNAKRAHLTELYLYTSHIELYEKFGWKYIGDAPTFKKDAPIQRLYQFEIKE